MHPYMVIPLVSCVASAMIGAAILARDPGRRASRLAALLVGGVSWWAACEVLWNTAEDPAVVLRLVKLSSIGWAALGPAVLHLFCELAQAPAPRIRRALPALYAFSVAVVATDLTTSLIHDGVVTRHAWGWSYGLARGYAAFYVFTMSCAVLAMWVMWRTFRSSPSGAEREQVLLLMLGISIPATVASATDGLLPLLGFQVPRFGTAAFVLLNAVIAWTLYRYTYPLVAPTSFGREIFEALGEGIALLRPDGWVRAANASLGRLVGCPSAQLESRLAGDLIPGLGDPLREVVEQECALLDAGNQRIPVSVSSSVVHERSGQPVAVVLVVRDLREVVELRSRLVTSGRLAAVGELAAGIAHEINNPIAYARSNLGLLQEHWDELAKRLENRADSDMRDRTDEGRQIIDETIEGVDRAASIVRDVLGFSHAGHGQRELVDINDALEAALRVGAPQLRQRGRVETAYADLPLVRGSTQELKQVFLNLVLNAAQAIAEDGLIRVTTRAEEGGVCVCIEDDGCGIDPELLQRVFDPFFTTKTVGEGTGLGLAIAYQIVTSHDGEIRVESPAGVGTCFEVRLPGGGDPGAGI
jgi:signal transduction histidine kinase